MNVVKQITIDIMVDENIDGEYLAEYIMKQLNGKTNMILDGKVVGQSFKDDVTDEYKLYYPELAKEGFRTIKFTAGPSPEFEIISTDAPDSVIKAHMQYISACEEEGAMIENPYIIIESMGYKVNIIGCHDDFDDEDMEEAIIDEYFDYYKF